VRAQQLEHRVVREPLHDAARAHGREQLRERPRSRGCRRGMRPVLLVLAFAATALVPASAHAKMVSSARACDDDGCRTITAKRTLRQMEGGAPTSAPDEGAPFHRVRMTVKAGGVEEHAYTMVYVPSAGLMRFGGEGSGYEWLAATPRARRGFERLLRGLEPLPARRLRGVGVAEPTAQVHKVVSGASFRDDGGGGFPWLLVAIPGALALAVAASLLVIRKRGVGPVVTS
jgi:hypothetical protein